jgi:peptide-methionine (R)-S-oxide reductase
MSIGAWLRGLAGRPPRKGHEMDIETKTYPVSFTDAEWRARLTDEQYQVLRHHGTERPGSCALLREKRPGTFACAGCGNALFQGETKFESGTGWPSFDTPLPGAVETTEDRTFGMLRVERGVIVFTSPARVRLRRPRRCPHARA